MIGSEPNGIIAVFPTAAKADAALHALLDSGFDMQGVTVLGPGRPKGDDVPPELDRGKEHSIEVAKYWARWGGIIGAGLGLALIGIPAIAAVVGLGAFAPLLAAVPAVTTASGALGTALIGLGVHEGHAARYEHALAEGKIVVLAHADDRIVLTEARDVLAAHAPEVIDVHGLRKLTA